jgi:DNA invertase Pin-like site-specific DNA recombinase
MDRTVKQLDAYIRVSRVAGRHGESFISPDVQRERILAYASARGFSIAETFTDLDVSGGKLKRPELEKALVRIDRGESGGIVVAKLDRFARSLAGALHVIERIKSAGGVILSAEGDFDTSTPVGKMVAQIMLTLGEYELDRIRDNWSTAQERAVRRGVHVASRTPTGYRRRSDGRLEPDADSAPVIRELFQRRAAGEGWTALSEFLDDSKVSGPYDNVAWTPSATAKIIGNRVYLGEARSGRYVNREAHEPIVPRAEWEAAQSAPTGTTVGNGGALLAGIARCAGCRYVLKGDTMRGRNGGQLRIYRCRGKHAAGRCSSPATIMARLIDPFVEQSFLAAIGQNGPLAEASMATAELEAAELRLRDVELELRTYLATNLATVIGTDAFVAGAESRQQAVDEAQRNLHAAHERAELSGLITTSGSMIDAWPTLTTAEKRSLLAAGLDAAFVRAVRGSGRSASVTDRVALLWRGQAPGDLPGRGRRVPLAPFPWPD